MGILNGFSLQKSRCCDRKFFSARNATPIACTLSSIIYCDIHISKSFGTANAPPTCIHTVFLYLKCKIFWHCKCSANIQTIYIDVKSEYFGTANAAPAQYKRYLYVYMFDVDIQPGLLVEYLIE